MAISSSLLVALARWLLIARTVAVFKQMLVVPPESINGSDSEDLSGDLLGFLWEFWPCYELSSFCELDVVRPLITGKVVSLSECSVALSKVDFCAIALG